MDYPERFSQFLNEIEKDESIDIHVNSPGGDVFQGITLYNMVKEESEKRKVSVKVKGLAASIASIIPLAVKESTLEDGSMVMIHNPWAFTFGDASELRDQAEVLDKVKASLVSIYNQSLSVGKKEISDLMNDETWFTVDEAQDKGFGMKKKTSKAQAGSTKNYFESGKYSWIKKNPIKVFDLKDQKKTEFKNRCADILKRFKRA